MNYDLPHRRRNPLTGEWVLVSAHRTNRPWQGSEEEVERPDIPAYEPSCYLCPGNGRAGGVRNPAYAGTFVFDNDFPALMPDTDTATERKAPWMESVGEAGVCRVVCYSPRHDLALGDLEVRHVRGVVDTWVSQVAELLAQPDIDYVQVFENKGAAMGASNPHPHGQIWSTAGTPNEIAKEDTCQAAYLQEHGSCLLCAVLEDERKLAERVVVENSEWSAVVPYWAVWPFELLLLSRKHTACLTGLDERQKDSLAESWQQVIRIYDNLFGVPMPMSCGWHIAPKSTVNRSAWHTHAHFYPPLLRSATVRKFMVGYEMLGGAQRDITPEMAAERLREQA